MSATRPGGPARPVFCFRFSPAPRVSFPFRVQTTPRRRGEEGGKRAGCRETTAAGGEERHMAASAAPQGGQGPAAARRGAGRVAAGLPQGCDGGCGAGPHPAEQPRWSLLEPQVRLLAGGVRGYLASHLVPWCCSRHVLHGYFSLLRFVFELLFLGKEGKRLKIGVMLALLASLS